MKSEERHKLQENVLAKSLTGVVERVGPYMNAILAVLLLVIVVFGVWKWWHQQSASAAANAWDDLYAAIGANDPAALDRVVEQNQGTEVAYWAATLSGDIHLASGCQDLFANKATASQELQKAVEKYLLVRSESSTAALRERATFGLARAYEAQAGTRQSQGELSKAIQSYEEVVKNWPKGAYAAAAQQRIDDLKKPATKSFYDKFAQYDPQPAFTPGGPGKPLFDSKSLPEGAPIPDFSKKLDDAAKDKTPAKDEAKPVEKAPVKEEAKPAEKAPAKEPEAKK
jgi:hypothetical protein